jgi:hypothetical protein
MPAAAWLINLGFAAGGNEAGLAIEEAWEASMYKSGDEIAVRFYCRKNASLELVDADSLPAAVLLVNGVASPAVVTVTKPATGTYLASVTLPTITDGDVLQLCVTATVSEKNQGGTIWFGVGCTSRTVDAYQLLAAQRVIDQTATPWQLVLTDRTSGVEIMRFDLKDEDGDAIDSIATFVAEQTTPA